MTSESKILTVSYGTFSCTLEGFDDPFNTMKAIAEYFRDLTAEDRYFGAEPPQPDAAMLHRIAEREVSRLVDARVRDNGVHLRPQDPAPAADDGHGKAAPMPPMRQPRDPASRVSRQPAPVAPAVAEPVLQDNMPSGVAAKLARIRQSVTPQPFAAELPAEALSPFIEDEADAPIPAAVTLDAAELDLTPAAGSYTADQDDVAEQDDMAADPVGRDALSQLDALLRAPVDASVDAVEAMPETPAEDPVVALEEAPAPVEDSADPWMAETVDGADPDFLAQEPAAEMEAAALETALADVLPEATVEPTEALVEDQIPEAPFAEDTAAEAVAEAAEEPLAVAPAAPKSAGRSKRVSSRIVRIHPDEEDYDPEDRADPQAARRLAPGGEEAEVARLLRQADDVMADVDNRRRLDSIAHLKAAVAATEAERAVTGEIKPPAEQKQDPYRDDLAQVVQPDPEPAAVAPPVVTPRRKTVSVRPQEPRPGTIRPGMISPPPLVLVSEQRIDRMPLPQAPVETPAAAQMPTEVAAPAAYAPAPAPDRDMQPAVGLRTGRLSGAIGIGAASASPILPHQKIVLEQPSHATELEDDEDQDEDLSATEQAGLVDFAERVGVKSMAEMLEAAAAYATCIEKRSQFTRPQLMRRLMASAGDRQVSREDGLRSFGTLLRTGRIEKVSRGHYMLAESSPYLAEARRMS